MLQKLNESLSGYSPVTLITASAGTVAAAWAGKTIYDQSETLYEDIVGGAVRVARSAPGVSGKVKEEQEKVKKILSDQLNEKTSFSESFLSLPQDGLGYEEVTNRMQELRDHEESLWKSARCSGTVYVGSDEHERFLANTYAMFGLTNGLHADVFPSIRKFEAEVVEMAVEMMHGKGKGVCGAMTSGGTESILMAMKVYRDSRPEIRKPEIILTNSAHAAFFKAGDYFKIKMVSVPVGSDFKADVKRMASKINRNTIAMVASAPSFPQGVIDPIEELAQIAKKAGIGLHIDCCLGGFVLPFLQRSKHDYGIPPFDFAVDGVTTMSADTHKYGQSPKGSSIVLFRNEELRRKMYFITTEWPGGLYASPTMAGSKPGANVAGTWASMVAIGYKGYIDAAERTMAVAKHIAQGIRDMDGVELVADGASDKFPIVTFEAVDFDTYKIMDALKGWNLNVLQKPKCIHLCCTPRHADGDIANQFLEDLADAVAKIKENPDGFATLAPMYGMVATMPDRSLITEFVMNYLDMVLKA